VNWSIITAGTLISVAPLLFVQSFMFAGIK
jgi:hypothetical protein